MTHPIFDNTNFVNADIQEREVELADGKTHTLKFKRLPGVEYYAFATAQRSEDDDLRIKAIARLVSVSLVDDEGNRVLTVEQAAQLKGDVLNNLLAAANEVNQEKQGNGSTPEVTDTSGT